MIDGGTQELTKFQEKCYSKTLELLQDADFDVSIVEIDITCILFKLHDPKIEIWIYDDECMFFGNDVNINYESCDFDSEDILISQYLSGLAGYLEL